MADILYESADGVFSYRVAGIYIEDGRILLQKPDSDDAYSLPGGHVAFGETNAETLKREYKEEMGLDITVGKLRWVMENFFPWGDRVCHQVGTFYLIDIDKDLPEKFLCNEKDCIDGGNIWFYMFPIEDLDKITVYPLGLKKLIEDIDGEIKHLIYKEI